MVDSGGENVSRFVIPRGFFAASLTAAAIVFSAPLSYGQAVAVAEIRGQVLDSSGAAVAGAALRAVQTDTQYTRTANSDADGSYVLPNLPIGPYRLEVTAKGFKTNLQSGIVLQVGNNIQVNVGLQVGSITENVEVRAQASMVETKDTSVSQVIDERRILDLPLNGRQATSLVLLAGGATYAPSAGNDSVGSKSFYSSVVISVAGSQGNNLNYLLDGGDNNDTFSNVNLPFPFPDALQEFSVETNALPARNGLHPGGAVNIVTKSGANQMHGDLFEFLRNGSVNARNYFLATHDVLHRNQFGGTVGGRIIKDKLFFFGGYQGTRQVQTVPQSSIVLPTPAAISGDFSLLDKTKQLVDPVNGTPFAGNRIPVTRFDPAAVAFAKYLPAVSDPSGTFTYSIPRTGNEDQLIGRVDFLQSSKNTMFGRYFLVDYSNPAVWDPHNVLVTTTTGNLERAQSVTLGDTYSFGANAVNSLHATFSRRRNNRSSAQEMIGPKDLGIASANLSPTIPNYLQIQLGSTSIVGCSTCTPAHFNVNTFQVADDFDLLRGKHQLAFGVDIIRTQNNTYAGYKENGSFFFGNISSVSSGDSSADMMIGALGEYDQSRPQQTAYRQTIPGFYAQDTIKWSSRITVNLGLRWEPMLYATDYFERGSTFSMPAFLSHTHSQVYPNAPAGMFYWGDAGVPAAFTNNKIVNLSPRVGVVWNPHGDGRDTVRAGIGVLYNTPEAWFFQRLASNPPVVNEIDLTGTSVGTFSAPWAKYPGGNPFPGVVPAPKNVIFPTSTLWVVLPPNMKPTSITEWNLSYQRQFAGNWMGSASYIGTKTSHLWLGYDLNAAIPVGGIPISDIADRRPLHILSPADGALIGSLLEIDDGGNATYNGLLVSVQHRFSHGFTLLSNYTWSHCISDGDSVGNIRQTYYQIQTNRRADRGACNFDTRHIFNTSFVIQSPMTGQKGVAAQVLGGWQFAPIIRATTGIATNLTAGADNSGTGDSSLLVTDRPNLVMSDPYMHNWGPAAPQFINPAAFVANPSGTFGNLGRDAVNGPAQFNFDTSLSRIFTFAERLKLEARFEAFNAINHTNFSTLEVRQNNKNFGKLTAANDPRILQFALKLTF
jgi:hypothetical protein